MQMRLNLQFHSKAIERFQLSIFFVCILWKSFPVINLLLTSACKYLHRPRIEIHSSRQVAVEITFWSREPLQYNYAVSKRIQWISNFCVALISTFYFLQQKRKKKNIRESRFDSKMQFLEKQLSSMTYCQIGCELRWFQAYCIHSQCSMQTINIYIGKEYTSNEWRKMWRNKRHMRANAWPLLVAMALGKQMKQQIVIDYGQRA